MSIGYYWVKHFNHTELKIMYFNGFRFEMFASDSHIDDEIESYIEVAPPNITECANFYTQQPLYKMPRSALHKAANVGRNARFENLY